MAKATIVKELIVKTPNRVCMLAEVAGIITKSGANISALNAFGIDSDAIFRIVTSDNAAAIKELKAKRIEASEKDAVRVELENSSGKAAEMAEKMKAASIDIKYIYATACNCDCPCGLVLNTSDNKKTVEILNK